MDVSQQEQFLRRFVSEMHHQGMPPQDMSRFVLRPHDPQALAYSGDGRDRSVAPLLMSASEITELLNEGDMPAPLGCTESDTCGSDLVLIMVPGFTHETLKHYSWHELMDDAASPHHLLVLNPGGPGQPSLETHRARGQGARLVYPRYPRSNADSETIVPGLFDLLHHSETLKQWADEGRRLVFVGYSNGAPLSLELLAGLNQGRFGDSWLLHATAGFISLCGDIGGSYLADDVTSASPTFINMAALIERAGRNRLVATLAGLSTPQLRQDMANGVRALGHEVRQQRMAEWLPALPPSLHYFSLAAVLPLADYRRRLWQFNLDDYAMWRQAQITDPITVYNDGQVALRDAMLPTPPQVDAARVHYLGALRAHHWAVSYRTFNLGRSRFPRAAMNRAIMGTLYAHLADDNA